MKNNRVLTIFHYLPGNAVKEQMSGLDLTMPSMKHEPGDYDDEDDVESNVGSEDSNMSGSLHGEVKTEPKETPVTSQGRSSRRKPAAPQWVNPEWQDEKEKQSTGDEVIINGVCVMQTEDYGRRDAEETVRVEPTPVLDRFEEERSETSSVSNEEAQREDKGAAPDEEKSVETKEEVGENVHKNEEEGRWDY